MSKVHLFILNSQEEPSSLEASMVGWLGGLDVPGGTTATDSERARVWMGGEPKVR